MKPVSIPISAAPGDTQHQDDELQFVEMPRGMMTFSMPDVPEHADATTLLDACRVLQTLLTAVENWAFSERAAGPRCDIFDLSQEVLDVLNGVLGEGEVSARVEDAQSGRNISVQESVFPGLWRVREFDAAGQETAHWIEAGAMPRVVVESAQQSSAPDFPTITLPDETMNAAALFVEMNEQLKKFDPDAAAYVINLTLLPLNPADYDALLLALPVGPVAIMSRGFGSCKVSSTGVRHIWRVQHFNNKNHLILNTLTITECPREVCAAQEDIDDMKERLADLLAWMRDCAQDQQVQ
jgi:HupH hydrogenase expression protein, C-terminal conserved region.